MAPYRKRPVEVEAFRWGDIVRAGGDDEVNMARYALFAGKCYEEGGGIHDLVSLHDTVEEARQAFHTDRPDDEWAHIVECRTLDIVDEFVYPGGNQTGYWESETRSAEVTP